MNSSNVSVDIQELATRLREAAVLGRSQEALIDDMRAAGLNQIACIKLLRDITGMSLEDAKETVHYSRCWSDRRGPNDVLHEVALGAAKELGFHEVTG